MCAAHQGDIGIRRRGFVSTAVTSLHEEFQVADQRAFPPRVELEGVEYTPATEGRGARARRELSAWWRVCITFDVLLFGAASLAADLGARSAGVTALPIIWIVGFGVILMAIFVARG